MFKSLKKTPHSLSFAFWLFLCPLIPLNAQGPYLSFLVSQAKVMSNNAISLAVVQPSNGARNVQFLFARVECPSANRVQIVMDCETAPTETATTVHAIGNPRKTPNILGYQDATASTCTEIANLILLANTPLTIDLSAVRFSTSAAHNLAIQTGNVASGTCRAYIVGREY